MNGQLGVVSSPKSDLYQRKPLKQWGGNVRGIQKKGRRLGRDLSIEKKVGVLQRIIGRQNLETNCFGKKVLGPKRQGGSSEFSGEEREGEGKTKNLKTASRISGNSWKQDHIEGTVAEG